MKRRPRPAVGREVVALDGGPSYERGPTASRGARLNKYPSIAHVAPARGPHGDSNRG